MTPNMHYNSEQTVALPAGDVPEWPAPFAARGLKEFLMARFRSYLQHRLNPLHIYCRLCERGFSSRAARRLSSVYERLYRVCGLGLPRV